MTSYALDTNIVSYYLKNNQDIINKVDIALADNNRIIISPIVYFEIKRWLLSNNASIKLTAFEKLCSYSGVGIIDKDLLEIATSLYVELKKQGMTIEDADILIASDCIKNNLVLVTNNMKHFKAIKGLQVINWIS
ncbi:MAG: PIN domain-containing protein [Planctomycetaceae bacterium]|jgi:predicted nucleic acid-binding protein|nr:PIN domain-containing protein [Planctomycetaceae bacterium]